MFPSSDGEALSLSLLGFSYNVSLLFPWDGLIIGYYVVNLLSIAGKLDGITTVYVASRAGFFVFVCPMRSVIFRLFLDYCELCRILLRSMHQAYVCTVHTITRIA